MRRNTGCGKNNVNLAGFLREPFKVKEKASCTMLQSWEMRKLLFHQYPNGRFTGK